MTGKTGNRREAGSRSRDGRPVPLAGQNLQGCTPSRAGRTGDTGNCLNRLQGAVAALMDEGVAPDVIMESLTAIRRNQDLPVPRFNRLTAVIAAASGMSLKELYRLDTWLYARIRDEKAIPPPPWRILLEKRQGPGITCQLELRRCSKKNCRKCRQGPSHGPCWYAYGPGAGPSRRRYVGRELDPQTLAATVKVDLESEA